MTKGETKMLETDAVIFPMKYTETKSATDSQMNQIVTETQTVKSDIKLRFARLKRSIKKRSASIL